jgi:hypothetical protein
MPKQFWVIGGEYRDLEFRDVIEGTTRVLGPFGSYHDARVVWHERSQASRAVATARYTIVSNAMGDR